MNDFNLIDVPLVQDALGKGSNRRLGLISTIVNCVKADRAIELTDLLCGIHDKLHASACIVDDLLDNEIYRAGTRTYFARNGKHCAAIAALHLLSSACLEISKTGIDARQSLSRLCDLIYSEEADVGLLVIKDGYDPIQWYEDVSSKKTTHEILLILDIAVHMSQKLKKNEVNSLYASISHLGHILQITNDWRDMFERDPFYRTGFGDEYVVTFSLPLATYCQHTDPKMLAMIGKRLSSNDAHGLMHKILNKSNKALCKTYIHDKLSKFAIHVETQGMQQHEGLFKIAESAVFGQFWSDRIENVS